MKKGEAGMFGNGSLSFQEFRTRNPWPLATIQEAVLEFLRSRTDAVLFGAQAVNAYTEPPRMTQDVDILSTRARDLAEELQKHLHDRFHIAVRIREVAGGRGLRIYQATKDEKRHLVDIRPIPHMPKTRSVAGVLVITPPELIAGKVLSFCERRKQPKAGTDWRDLAVLLLAFPKLKKFEGPVLDYLRETKAKFRDEAIQTWKSLVASEIEEEGEGDEFR